MNITDYLLQQDPSLTRHQESEWSSDTKGFTAFNSAGIEVETGEFLYSLVRLLKPTRVLETGTHHGVGASYMGLGLRDNGFGLLDTIEFSRENWGVAQHRIDTLGLSNIVSCHLMDVADYEATSGNCELILLDTEPQTRFAELVKFYPVLAPGGFIFIHDLHRGMCQGNINPDWPDFPSWPFGNIPDAVKDLVAQGKLRPMHFPTPRGLTGFYKTSSEDFQWNA